MLMPFISALINFNENGFFELTNAQLFLDNIQVLDRRIKQLKADNPEIHFYRICLNTITIIPGVSPQVHPPQPVLSGAITEHNSRDWSETFTDVALTQMMSRNAFTSPLNIRDYKKNKEQQLATLKDALFSLLTQLDIWSSIELQKVFFYQDHQINNTVTEQFYKELLNALVKNDSLRELSLKSFSLTKHQKHLINFLSQHTTLEALHLGIDEANRQDWLALSDSLARHPKLKFLNLNNSVLDVHAYSAVSNLLDRNYRIDISLPEPIENNLWEVYESLSQRVLKPGLERFKADHLTQAKLLQVALTALEYLHKLKSTDHKERGFFEKQFDFLAGNEGYLAITPDQKEAWAKSTAVLPFIYQNHIDYLKYESPLVQLQMSEWAADGSRTIGYVLLEKALETQNQAALKTLLNTNINLFEFPDDADEPFLVKALQRKGGVKKVVVDYIRGDQRLIELAAEYLATYPNLRDLFKAFKDHLDDYGAHLVKKDNPHLLLLIAKKILHTWRSILDFENPSSRRGKECAEIYLALEKSLQIMGPVSEEDSYDSFDKVHELVIQMKENSIKALRGFFNTSFLHEEVLKLIHKFEMQLLVSKKGINHVKNDTLKQHCETINYLKEHHKQERFELETKNAEVKAENADLRAQSAATETKNAEIKAENADLRAQIMEMEAIKKQMGEQLKTLMKQQTTPSYPEEVNDTACATQGFFRP